MGYRYYDPGTGRFLTRDPIGYAGGANLYACVDGDPVNWADPWGLEKESFLHRVGKALKVAWDHVKGDIWGMGLKRVTNNSLTTGAALKVGGYAISAAKGCATVQEVTHWSDRIGDQNEQRALAAGVDGAAYRDIWPNQRVIWGGNNVRR